MFREVIEQLRPATLVFAALTLLTGIAYPLLVTGIAAGVFPRQSAGSLIVRDGEVIGSELIGQPFDDEQYFWGRPSATAPFACNAGASSGSNLGPTNPALVDAVKQRVASIQAAHSGQSGDIPIELVTASASGLDPHISPAAAEFQVARVAKVRGWSEDTVRQLLHQHTESRQLGILGEPRINVLRLNLALDQQ